jgi:hypothetical protein
VRVCRSDYETFERMHYVCFHYEFEHHRAGADTDPDEDCGLAGCPSAQAVPHPDQLVTTIRTLLADWSAGPPANWDNHSVPDYLGCLASWLDNAEAHHTARGLPLPWNAWNVLDAALRAATHHE